MPAVQADLGGGVNQGEGLRGFEAARPRPRQLGALERAFVDGACGLVVIAEL